MSLLESGEEMSQVGKPRPQHTNTSTRAKGTGKLHIEDSSHRQSCDILYKQDIVCRLVSKLVTKYIFIMVTNDGVMQSTIYRRLILKLKMSASEYLSDIISSTKHVSKCIYMYVYALSNYNYS